MEEIAAFLLALLVLVAPSGLAWIIVKWLDRPQPVGERRNGP
jgi:hypothetical protein